MMLAADTPVFVFPGAWTTVGELSPGDRVYGPDGAPRGVLSVSRSELREVRRVTTRSMGFIDMTVDHEVPCERVVRDSETGGEWVESRWAPGDTGPGRSTPALLGHDPIRIPHRAPGFDPYVYGRWLGDGVAHKGAIVGHSVDDREALIELGAGNELRHDGRPGAEGVRVTVPGLCRYLREEGLIWREGGRDRGVKRMIDTHIYNDEHTRWSVLQGVMDSDGSLEVTGAARIESSYPRIQHIIGLLLVMDGQEFSWSRKMNHWNGRRVKDSVAFRLQSERNPFRMSAHKVEGFRPVSRRVRRHRLRSIRTWDSLPGPLPCVDVEVEGRTFLAGHELHQVM